jgi:hypothetical protein
MKHQFLSRYVTTGIFVIIIYIATISMCSTINESEKNMHMRELVPNEFYGWKAQSEVEVYDRKTIFDYIDGAGEIYLLYGFRKVMVFHLAKVDQPPITVEIFDMGSSEDAFGVFSHAREGEEIGIGQGSEYRGGVLCFWKGDFFVCILSERETPEAKEAVFHLAQKIAGNIKVTGKKPQLLGYLPTEGLLERSVRYFHLHASLNYHYFVASQNILKLNQKTEAVLARYLPDQSYLLFIRYQNQKQAKEAFDSFLSAYIPEAKESGTAQIENGNWVAAKLKGVFVAVVFDAPTEASAQALLDAFRNKLLESASSQVKS